MITYDKESQEIVFKCKLTKSFIENLVEISGLRASEDLENLIVEKFKEDMADFSIRKEDFGDE